jgi:hypothetical protein
VEGDGFGTVMGMVSNWVRNGFRPQRREADGSGPQDTGACLAAPQGRKRSGPASRVELGWGSARCWVDMEKTARDPFLIFKFLFPFDFSCIWK